MPIKKVDPNSGAIIFELTEEERKDKELKNDVKYLKGCIIELESRLSTLELFVKELISNGI